jgi:Rrf2 family iron-sulfur cluster assembly transcriptional regulator
MMKLSNKERYALQALFDLAFHHNGSPAQAKDIAVRQHIPARFLEQIFQDLKRAGLVGSKRGPRGGYHLAKDPREICVGDVLRATSGPVAGFGARRAKAHAPKDLREITDAVLHDLAASVERCFDAVTLEDVCTRGEALGIHRDVARSAARYAI